MERQHVLATVIATDALIAQETARLQQMRDNPKLDDPSKLPVLFVKEYKQVTPDAVRLSAELIIRNAALKAIGDCSNYADEANAKANIASAEGRLYESGNVEMSGAAPEVLDDKKKATK